SLQVVQLAPAACWSNVPESASPALAQEVVIPSAAADVHPERTFAFYLYDCTVDGEQNCDRVLVTAAERDSARGGTQAVAGAAVKVALTGERDGQTAGFYLTPTEISPDGTSVSLYYTGISRVRASYTGCDATATCAADFNETVASELPTTIYIDYGPLEAGL